MILPLCGLCSPVINKGGVYTVSKEIDHRLPKCRELQTGLLMIKYYYLPTRHFDVLNTN